MATFATRTIADKAPPRRAWQTIAAATGAAIWTLAPVLYTAAGLPAGVEAPALMALAPPLLLVGVWGFNDRYGGAYSRWGRAGLLGLAAGLLGLWPFALVQLADVGFALGFAAYYAALAAAVVVELGAGLLAVDCWRTGTPSRWLGLWFPLALPLGALGNYLALQATASFWMGNHLYAGLAGLPWVAFAYRLWRPVQADGPAGTTGG